MKIHRLIPPPLGVPIGYRKSGAPIYPVFGGSDDLDIEPDEEVEDEEPDEEAEPQDEEPKGGKKGKYTPPEEAEWLRTRNALAKANASAKQRREALAAKDKELAELKAAIAKREADDERRRLVEERLAAAEGDGSKSKRRGKAGGGVPAALVDLPDGVMTKAQVKQATQAAEKAAEERAAERFRTMAVGAAARGALMGEGISKDAAGKLIKLLDLDEVELDTETGEITSGLDDQLEQLKAEFPQLFAKAEPEPPKPKRRPAPRITPAPQAEVETRPLSSAERMASMVLGNR